MPPLVRQVDPLNHAVPIVDKEGRPTQQFVRQWALSRTASEATGALLTDHTHDFSDITGTLLDAQVSQNAVTQHQGALSINPSQVPSGTFPGPDPYNFSGAVRFPLGTVGAPGLAFSGESGSGIYRSAPGEIGFAVGGALRFTVRGTDVESAGDVIANGSGGAGLTPIFGLNDLNDVSLGTPLEGHGLIYQSGQWVNAATFAPAAHTHPWSEITSKPTTFAPSAHTHPWGEVTDKPVTFTPSAHTHPAGEVTAGTFGTGNFAFPGTLQVQGDISTVAGDVIANGSGGAGLTPIFVLNDLNDVSIGTPAEGHGLVYSGGSWVNAATFAPSAHTHPASEVTPGAFPSGSWSFTGTLAVVGNFSMRSAGPQLSWYETDAAAQEKNWRIVAEAGALYFQGREDDGQTFANPTFMIFRRSGVTATSVDIGTFTHIYRSADEILRLTQQVATGSPYISFYQSGTRRVYIQYFDGDPSLRLATEEAGAYVQFRTAGAERLRIGDAVVNQYVRSDILAGVDNLLYLRTTSATGNPQLAFYQAGDRRAYIQYFDSGDRFVLNAELANTARMELHAAGAERLRIHQRGISTVGSETTGRIRMDTTGPYVELAQRGWSGTAGILFSAYASDTYVDGGLATLGNTKHKYPASQFGTADHRAKAIVTFHNFFDFYISGASGGADTNVTWGSPVLRIAETYIESLGDVIANVA